MEDHINNLCSRSYYHLRNIRNTKKYLPNTLLRTAVHAFAINRIDHCNSLLVGLPQSQIHKLQKVQNCAARLLTRVDRFDHVTPVLKELHWLPVKYRIIFKFLSLIYQYIKSQIPRYLSFHLPIYYPNTALRSADNGTLVERKPTNLKTWRPHDIQNS